MQQDFHARKTFNCTGVQKCVTCTDYLARRLYKKVTANRSRASIVYVKQYEHT